MKKRWIIGLLALLLLAAALKILSRKPILIGAENLPASLRETVTGQAGGLYSSRLPLVPVCVVIDGVSATSVDYTIHYFPFGSVGMTWVEGDGYSIEAPLMR